MSGRHIKSLTVDHQLFQEEHGEDPKDPWTYYAGECTKSSEFCQLFDGASYTNVSTIGFEAPK